MNPTVNSNANGRSTGDILELMVLGNQAVEKGVIKIYDDVQDKIELSRMSITDNLLQKRVATPTNSKGDLLRDGRTIVPLDAMVYYRFNPRNLESDWREFQPKGPLVDKVTNPKIQKAILSVTRKSINNQVGRIIWQGDSTLPDTSALHFFDGYEKIADDDADTIKIASIGAITKANILQVLENFRKGIPKSIINDTDFRIHMSTTNVQNYEDAVNDLSFKGPDPTTTVEHKYKNLIIEDYEGMSDDSILGCISSSGVDSNLNAAVNMTNDTDNIKMERFRPESEEFFVKVLFKMAVNFAWTQEAVLYKA